MTEISNYEREVEEERQRLPSAISFHERRLAEMQTYDALLDGLFLKETADRKSKDVLSHENLLRKARAYQIMMLIWRASPYANGLESWDNWTTEQTSYGLAARLAVTQGDHNRTAGYIDRVVEAAEHFRLVTRERIQPKNRQLIKATERLHLLMCRFAEQCNSRPNARDCND